MRYSEINLKKILREEILKVISKEVLDKPTASEKKEIQKKIEESVSSSDYRSAINSLILGISFDSSKTFYNLRKKGFFRYSKYISKKCILHSLASDLIKIYNKSDIISLEDQEYLNSIINFSPVYSQYKNINKFILEEIKSFNRKYKGKSLIKTLLAFVDYLFLYNYHPDSMTNLNSLKGRSKENISEAVSFLIFLISDIKKITAFDTTFIEEEYIKSGAISRIISAACYISDFKELEILIANFDYQCIAKSGKIKIIPPSEQFDKSMRLGYIRTEIQEFNDLLGIAEFEGITIEDLAERMNKEFKDIEFLKYTETSNYPRYILAYPEPIYEFLVDKYFKCDNLFKDEIIYLSSIFKEQILNYEDLKKIKIKDDFCLMDFIKIIRVFNFFYYLFYENLKNRDNIDFLSVYRSLIPVFSKESLHYLLDKITAKENVDFFLESFSWKPSSKFIFDLQYHPIIEVGDHLIISLSVLCKSNYIRNLFASEYKKNNKNLFSNGLVDSLVDRMSIALDKAQISNWKQIQLPNTDIDLLAVFDNTVLVFECKHSLHPVTVFDLRTTYDYIKKAEQQLDSISYENLEELVRAKTKIEINENTNIIKCILLSNRMFCGNVFRYPVRHINEVANFIKNGTMITSNGVFSLWENNVLDENDLVHYFSLNSDLVNLLQSSLSKITLSHDLLESNIERDHYYLDSEIAIPKLNEFTSKLRKISNQ